ncbi:9117_t:CDS:1, partial [Acaulospora morrowiae]
MDLEILNLEDSSGVKLEMQRNLNNTSAKLSEIESIGENKFGVDLRSKDITFSMAAIQPFLPLFANVLKIAMDLTRLYENAKYNKKICAALVDRMDIVERAVKYLQRHKQKNEKNF